MAAVGQVRGAVNLEDMLLPALALMLLIEGLLPFLSPRTWREAFTRMTQLNDGQIRFMGLISMLAGLLLLLLFR
ncbi:hypothetical protein EDC61_11721 [Sulfuritortus calidifontis]|uniref:DUF2065 domain-containing protein n=1 Tax=Sulfuritortus calidifontis TaxID=1914471 RepID=A0A4R3JSB5_9PROT|nr:hypothetical protein EDC61_11721 [Sulfuritortus calidifontis]